MRGIEPPTFGLGGRCSTIELHELACHNTLISLLVMLLISSYRKIHTSLHSYPNLLKLCLVVYTFSEIYPWLHTLVTSRPSPKLNTFLNSLYSATLPPRYPKIPEIIDIGNGLNTLNFLFCIPDPIGKWMMP